MLTPNFWNKLWSIHHLLFNSKNFRVIFSRSNSIEKSPIFVSFLRHANWHISMSSISCPSTTWDFLKSKWDQRVLSPLGFFGTVRLLWKFNIWVFLMFPAHKKTNVSSFWVQVYPFGYFWNCMIIQKFHDNCPLKIQTTLFQHLGPACSLVFSSTKEFSYLKF